MVDLTIDQHYLLDVFIVFFLDIAEKSKSSEGTPVKKQKKIAKPVETSNDSNDGMTVIQYDDSSDSLEKVDD